jgi:radical SAM protein with 4Fe4S-binding SPASM domain
MHDIILSYPPFQYTIEPTNACNLACTFCPQSNPAHVSIRPKGYLKPGNFLQFLNKVKEVQPGNRNLNLTLDGEPFVNPHFLELVKIAIENKFFPIFGTNGVLLNKEKANELIAIGPFRASIDFASDEIIFETIRGKKGDFGVVRENLLNLMILAKSNSNIHIDIHDITSFSGADPALSLARMRQLFPQKLPSRIRFYSRKFHNFCGHLNYERSKFKYRLCPYPWTQMAVTYSGDCVACCRDTAARSVFGNVFQSSLMTIWNNEAYQQFRQNLLLQCPDLNAACKECDLPRSGHESRWNPIYVAHSLLGR